MSKLLDEILSNDNMNLAFKSVKANKGTYGVDEVTLDDLSDYIKNNWKDIKSKIEERKYYPLPVRRVQIPKPNGSKRNLGIPTVMDRVIQQAMVQVLTPICEEYFSNYSYGFRPNRSAHDAIYKTLDLLNDGYEWIVDLDIEKYFDTVNHDKLISILRREVNDSLTLHLIRSFLFLSHPNLS